MLPCGMNDIHLKDYIVIHKVRQSVLIGDDPTDFSCGKENILWFFQSEKFFNLILPDQIKYFVCSGDDVAVPLPFELSDDGTADHSTMPGDIDFCILFHHNA